MSCCVSIVSISHGLIKPTSSKCKIVNNSQTAWKNGCLSNVAILQSTRGAPWIQWMGRGFISGFRSRTDVCLCLNWLNGFKINLTCDKESVFLSHALTSKLLCYCVRNINKWKTLVSKWTFRLLLRKHEFSYFIHTRRHKQFMKRKREERIKRERSKRKVLKSRVTRRF